MKKIGFVGFGNMGQALGKGFVSTAQDVEVGYYDPEVLKLDDVGKGKLRQFASLPELATWAKVIFLAIKPKVCSQVCRELAECLRGGEHLLVSIVAGVSGQKLEAFLGGEACEVAHRQEYVVAMPNTPMQVGEGVCCYYCGAGVTPQQAKLVQALFGSLGLARQVTPDLMDAVPAISGSAPAYVYLLVRAMGQAAVEQGFGAEDAYRLAAQTVLGAAKMVLETGEHPAVLEDKVCSPGGSTITAVSSLRAEGFVTAVRKAMSDCTEKIKRMKKD